MSRAVLTGVESSTPFDPIAECPDEAIAVFVPAYGPSGSDIHFPCIEGQCWWDTEQDDERRKNMCLMEFVAVSETDGVREFVFVARHDEGTKGWVLG